MGRRRAANQITRQLAFERDRGVCAKCSADCEMVKRVYWSIVFHDAQMFYGEIIGTDGKVFWEADHIIEVAEGGSDAPANIQTLCIPCHAEKTRLWQQTRERNRVVVEAVDVQSGKPIEAMVVQHEPEDVERPDYGASVAEMNRRIEDVRDYCRQFIFSRMNRSGQMWPKAMEPIESDAAYDPWIAH